MQPLVLMAQAHALPQALEAAWLALLPPQRREELLRWPARDARQRSLLGTQLLVEALRRNSFDAAALLTLRHPADGAPQLGVPLHFSISHCDDRVVCAAWTRAPLGVDIEAVGSGTAADVARYLTDAERAWAGADPRRFCAVWTAKEAVVKAAGARGLRDLARVAVAPDGGSARFDGTVWRVLALAVGPHHAATLALRAADAVPVVEHWQPDNAGLATTTPDLR